MGMPQVQGALALSEPVPLLDIFATGRDVFMFGDFVRIVFWSEQPMLGSDVVERVAVAKIVVPRATWLQLQHDNPVIANSA